MTMQRKAYGAKIETVGERQARVICSTGEVDRAGEIVVQDGIDTSAFKSNPIVLWQHDVNAPVAKATEIGPIDGKLMALVEFPPAGVSTKADEICGLLKSGVINAVSIGFNPLTTEPMDPGNPKKGPQKYLTCELAEFSFVSVPANKGALVVERQNKADNAENWKVGASRNLPLDEESAWDGPAAEASIFDKAGFDGESPDTAFARKGFLVYDSANPTLKGSYKLPFAKVKDGRLTAVASGIRAAASRLPQTDIPDDVQKKARAVIDHYEGKMSDKGTAAKITKATATIKTKGLYAVAQLCQVLDSLGFIEDMAEFEAEMEGDNSQVPAMLAAAMKVVADALLAMTAEEVAELLAEDTDEGEQAVTKGLVEQDAKPIVKLIVALQEKAGARISASNTAMLEAAASHMSTANDHMKSAMAACTKAADHIDTVMNPPPADDGDGGDSEDSSDTDKAAKTEALTRRARMVEVMQRQAAA